MPDWVRDIAATLRYPDSAQTVGRLTDQAGRPVRRDEHGAPLPDDQLWSGRRGPAEELNGLRTDLPNQVHLWASVRSHVEGHAAAWMRGQKGDQHVVLVVSRDPCVGRRGCQVALPPIIRKGSSLTVYVAEQGKPPRYFDTYKGNGRAIAE